MRVFLTGATGYIGSVVAEKLRAKGHEVIGLACTDSAATHLEERSIRVYRGELLNQGSMESAARFCDAVIHTASHNDVHSKKTDLATVQAVLRALEGTNKPFVYTSAVWVLGATGDTMADEDSPVNPLRLVEWRCEIEQLVLDGKNRGARTIVIRPGVVYGRGQGIPAMFVRKPARFDAIIHYVGDGNTRWPVVHVEDLAELYILAMEKAPAGSILHGVDSSSVRVSDIVQAAVQGANEHRTLESWDLQEARRHLGAFADALMLDQQVSSEKTKALLGWRPKKRTIREEFLRGSYGGSCVCS